MKSINTSPISGMQELLPPEQAVFNQLKKQVEEVFRLHGFQNIETPIIDRTEILLAKAGGDTEKQIYKVVKTKETEQDADQALRYDHTVPLARFITEHENNLTFPLKVSQIGRNFRGERAQKGRFREFYQCDIDIVGRNTLPTIYDAEIITTLYRALETFNLPALSIRISNRKILSGFLSELNLQAYTAEIFNIIDHAEKVPEKVTISRLQALSIGDDNVNKILTVMQIRGSREQTIARLRALSIQNEVFHQGIEELDTVLSSLEQHGLGPHLSADLSIIRGLDYYTGTVFETFLKDYQAIGSIASGGRYENLTSFFSSRPFPGVGGSIGLTRLFHVLKENNLLKNQITPPIDYALIPLSAKEYETAYALSQKLHQKGQSTDIILTEKDLKTKLSQAAKTATYAVVIGEQEAKTQNFVAKNLTTRAEIPLAP